MNFLRHPLYTALALGACTWLTVANTRGLGFFSTLQNTMRGGSGGYVHGGSHFSHK
jgi:hypothetical protein